VIWSAVQRLMLALSAGCIPMYVSGHRFWARFRPGIDGPAQYLSAWAAYSLAGYALLAVISVFRIRRAGAEVGEFAGWTTLLLAAAHFVFLTARTAPVRILPAEGVLLGLVALFFFSFRASAQPVAVLVLPVLMAFTFAALWRNRRNESEGSLLTEPLPNVPIRVFGALILIFIVAEPMHVPALRLGAKIQTNVLFYLVLTLLGFILYGVSWARIFLAPPPKITSPHLRNFAKQGIEGGYGKRRNHA
jgi:hypothetical protein